MWLLIVYFEKIRVFKAGEFALNTLAWDNGTRQEACFVGLKKVGGETLHLESQVMINRNSWAKGRRQEPAPGRLSQPKRPGSFDPALLKRSRGANRKHPAGLLAKLGASRIVAMSFCEPRSWTRVLSS